MTALKALAGGIVCGAVMFAPALLAAMWKAGVLL